MYGKLMSINDELMWKYYLFLTDLRGSEVEALKAEVAGGSYTHGGQKAPRVHHNCRISWRSCSRERR